MSVVTFSEDNTAIDIPVETVENDFPDEEILPLRRLSTFTHGANPFGSEINDEINHDRQKWDRFAYSILNELDEAISRTTDPLPIKCRKMKAANLTNSGVSECSVKHNAIFVKGGAAYYAYGDKNDTKCPRLSNLAPRTHDYDFTICCEAISDVGHAQIQDFFWTAIKQHECLLDLGNSKFVRIDKNIARKEYYHPGEKTILSGPDPQSPNGRVFGGPSDYLTLTTFTSTIRKFTNYRINAFLPTRRTPNGEYRLSVHHIVEFIFTAAATEYDYADTIYRLDRGPHYVIPVLDIVSLLKYSIYAMAMRGLDSKRWRKARQDYARISSFIEIVKNRHDLSKIVKSKAWSAAVEIFQFLSENLPHCSEDGFTSVSSGDTFFDEYFTCVDAKNLVWYVLNEIGFLKEAQAYETSEFPSSLSDIHLRFNCRFHYAKTKKFWVISSNAESSLFDVMGTSNVSYPGDFSCASNSYY